jgi:hypothetical protein
MRSVYEIVRVYPDKTEKVLQTVDQEADIPQHVETPHYVGTWINNNRKLLRYGRGEIRIRRKIFRPSIESIIITTVGDEPAIRLNIKYDEKLKSVLLCSQFIAGYGEKRYEELWRVTNFAKLPTLVDKELAYELMVEYDKLVDAFALKAKL